MFLMIFFCPINLLLRNDDDSFSCRRAGEHVFETLASTLKPTIHRLIALEPASRNLLRYGLVEFAQILLVPVDNDERSYPGFTSDLPDDSR